MANKKLVKIKPIMAVICDDVRQEVNGKPFIIGIYSGNIKLLDNISPTISAESPAMLPLTLWIPFKVSKAGSASVEVKIISPNPKYVAGVKMKMEFPTLPYPYETTALTLPSMVIPIDQEGTLKVLFKNTGDDWETLKEVPITINRPTAPSETSQPS